MSRQRSDVVMLWHVVPSTHQVRLVSIPRDTLIQMVAERSAYGQLNRINAAFDTGANLLVRTVEDNFGIPVHPWSRSTSGASRVP